MRLTREKFVEEMLAYIKTHQNYENWTKDEAILTTLNVLVGDIGAAQNFVYAIGLDVDLYEMKVNK